MTKPPAIFHARGVVRFVADRAIDMRDAIQPADAWDDDGETETAVPEEDLDALFALVAGSMNAPAWLRPGVARAVRSVRACRLAEIAHPDRVPLRDELTALRDLVASVAAKLEAKHVIAAMDGLDVGGGDGAGAFDWLTIMWQASVTGKSFLDKAIEEVPFGPGSNAKHYPVAVERPFMACAVFVRVAWEAARGGSVPHTGADAKAACREMWLLARGGERKPARQEDRADWLKYLRQVKQLPEASLDRYRVVLGCP